MREQFLQAPECFSAALGTFSIRNIWLSNYIYILVEENESVGFVYLGAISGLIAIIILQITVYFVQERRFKTNKNRLPNFIEVTKSVSRNLSFLDSLFSNNNIDLYLSNVQ